MYQVVCLWRDQVDAEPKLVYKSYDEAISCPETTCLCNTDEDRWRDYAKVNYNGMTLQNLPTPPLLIIPEYPELGDSDVQFFENPVSTKSGLLVNHPFNIGKDPD